MLQSWSDMSDISTGLKICFKIQSAAERLELFELRDIEAKPKVTLRKTRLVFFSRQVRKFAAFARLYTILSQVFIGKGPLFGSRLEIGPKVTLSPGSFD